MADSVTDKLIDVFRSHGYEGASLSLLAEATGLKRASLYYRFPGGKREMAEAVLAEVNDFFAAHVVGPLLSAEEPGARVRLAVQGLKAFYEDGRKSCLLDVLSLGEGGALFRPLICRMFTALKDALAAVARDSGHDPVTAERLAEEAVIRIQGALVLARGCNDPTPFLRVVDDLPAFLLLPAS
ncbi:TetR/AcrR family transcriptional regulator [Rhodocaloribacter sp.]